ncbi:MAG: exo-alpha-sialidase [Opitutaceae bacterium]|nr:exo-alpha-sialidase [Opitutaceae bacterium]
MVSLLNVPRVPEGVRALFAGAILTFGSSLSNANPTTVVYVANAENYTAPQVRYTGRPWIVSQSGYLEGTGRGHRLLGQPAPGEGDFVVSFNLGLPRGGRESSVVIDSVSEIVLHGETGAWELRGRFFRAGEKPIRINAPRFKPGNEFALSVERTAGRVRVVVDGKEIFSGACGTEALSSVGLDPGTGVVRLNTFTSSGNISEDTGRLFDNPFGMQLRPKPAGAREVFAPVIVREAPTNECSMVERQDGTMEIYHVTKPASDSVSVTASLDGGLTWSEPRVAFSIPGKAYYAVKAVEDRNHDLQVVYHLHGQGEGGYNGRLYEVYHTTQKHGREDWTPAQKVVPGYVGSIRGLTALKSGRLLLGVGRAVPGREKAPASGPDFGWHETLVYFTDDGGTTWQRSPDALKLELRKKFPTRYGAIEPVMIEKLNGSVWMLVRDRGGWLWESRSADGSRWSTLQPTRFISSDSPAELLRLHDGRMVLLLNACQNWGDPVSYAAGGREVLHAAISSDDGKTWRGFREVLHETNLAAGGDRGTAYPSAAETPDGKVAVVSGQGHSKHAVFLFDPDWLEEDAVKDDLTDGPTGWTQYGDEHLRVSVLEGGTRALAIPVKASGLCGASWNFPMAASGEVGLKLRVPAGITSLKLSLNDHFTRIDDAQAAAHAVYTWVLPLEKSADATWTEIKLNWWNADQGTGLSATMSGGQQTSLEAKRSAVFGVNYLRVEFTGSVDAGEVLIADTAARTLETASRD